MLKKHLEKFTLLSLSLVLVSSYSVSCALPQMRKWYHAYAADQVDLLISIPSIAILIVFLISIAFSGKLKERQTICAGLLLYSAAGLFPLFEVSYPAVLISRFFMGIGSGMVNTQAVSAISRRYEGEERSRLLGYRGATEALGNAILTLIAGVLLSFGWRRVFFIYLAGLPILILFLLLTSPASKSGPQDDLGVREKKSGGLSGRELSLALLGAAFCMLLIGSNTIISLRVPILMSERDIQSAAPGWLAAWISGDSQSGVILSAAITASILSGLFYYRLRRLLRGMFTILMLLLSALALAGICLGGSFLMMLLPAILWGASYAVLVTQALQTIAERTAPGHVNQGTNLVLVGCNLGAFLATYLMKAVAIFSGKTEAPLLLCAGIFMIIAASIFVMGMWSNRKERKEKAE